MRYLEYSTRFAGYITIAFFLFWGLAEALYTLQPFWLDEWFIIQNIKFRESQVLWGDLEYMQQFPRVYLQALKVISNSFNYSYSSLRLPSFIVHSAGVLLCLSLGRKLFKGYVPAVFAFVLIYISFKTSLDYFVQVKQYTMEMFLGLVAMWQMMSIHKILNKERLSMLHWVLLYISLGIVTFFSYTYPILAIGIFYIISVRNAMMKRDEMPQPYSPHIRALVLLSVVSITLFYIYDVMYVMHDSGMQDYWKDFIMKEGFSFKLFFGNIFKLFAHQGAGALFEIIFGILGIAGWALGYYEFRKNVKSQELLDIMVAFATTVVAVMVVLFALGKLPLGAHRLNAFATPLLAVLSINFLLWLKQYSRLKVPAIALLSILLLAQAGNVFSSVINNMTSEENKKKQGIYNQVSSCVLSAQDKKLPIVAHRSIAFPSDVHAEVTGDWVLETFPAYDVRSKLPVLAVDRREDAEAMMRAQKISAAMYIAADKCDVITID